MTSNYKKTALPGPSGMSAVNPIGTWSPALGYSLDILPLPLYLGSFVTV